MIARKANFTARFWSILYFFLTICIGYANELAAQTTYQLPPNQPEQDACNALQLCGSSFSTPYSYIGSGKHLDLDQSPCYNRSGGGEQNSMWLRLNVSQAGSIDFKITPVSRFDNYDFAVLDVTGKDCGSLSPSDVIRCNYNNNFPGSNINGIIGLSDTSRVSYVAKDSFGHSFAQEIFAKSNGVYLIMINNYGNYVGGGPSAGFTIDFSGSSAIFNNSSSPILKNVDVPCNNANTIIVKTTSPILCSSIAPDGSDFITNAPARIVSASGVNCTARGGYTNFIALNFSSVIPPGNYSVSVKQGSDNNTLTDLCSNPVALPAASISFIVKQNAKVAIDSESICYQQLPYYWNGFRITKGGDSVATYTTPSATGCDSTTILKLNVSNMPLQVNISKTICDGDVYQLPWDSTVTTAGNYVHHFLNINGCDSVVESVTVSVIIPRGGTVQQRDSTIETGFCINGSSLLSAGTGFKSYLWNTGQTTSSIIVNIAGTYSIMAIDNDGCLTIDTFVVARYPFPVPNFRRYENLCDGKNITLDAGAGGQYYLWSNGSTDQSIVVDMPGTYWVAIASGNNNCSSTDTVTVLPVSSPGRFLDKKITKCKSKQIKLNSSGRFIDYIWSNGSTESSINVTYGGLYWLTVKDENGCNGRDSIVVIDSLCPSFFYMPNAFTPNRDGRNDVFRPSFVGDLTNYHLTIYNRWGKAIFSTAQPYVGWNGEVDGYLQPLDTYIWICTYRLDGNPLQTASGSVTLLR